MPFIGRDWRAPGEAWVKTPHNNSWEQTKLRPVQISEAISIERSRDSLSDASSSSSLSSLEDARCSEDESSEADWIPHCFVKSKSKEFVGCTSMSEAFHRLDIARAVSDVRRFNYVCKVVQILVQEKLKNLSATARKSLLNIVQSLVLHSVEDDVDVSTVRHLVSQFGSGLDSHVCGSPQLVSRQLSTLGSLLDAIEERQPKTPADADDEAVTFVELPREVLLLVLRRLPDHLSLLETAKAHDTLAVLVEGEERLWKSLCSFHFTQQQIAARKKDVMTWRMAFFELKKFHGVREVYADLIHICCQCKALYWKGLGHPCVGKDAPSVRVTPHQFVDMLLFL